MLSHDLGEPMLKEKLTSLFEHWTDWKIDNLRIFNVVLIRYSSFLKCKFIDIQFFGTSRNSRIQTNKLMKMFLNNGYQI